MGVAWREASDRWNTTPQQALGRATEILPGGERMSIFASGSSININDIVDDWTIDSDQCKPWMGQPDGLRWCRAHCIDERLNDWQARNNVIGPAYDVLFGIHDYPGERAWTEVPVSRAGRQAATTRRSPPIRGASTRTTATSPWSATNPHAETTVSTDH